MDALEICYMSAGQLSGLIKSKEISPVEVIDAHLARIEATEPVLNSFITLLPDEARAAARRAEADIQAGKYRGPLHGIPVGLKDLFNTAGVRTTSGSKIFDNFIPTEDCTVAIKFREAGSILLGKLNMHQFAYGPTGENPDYGHMHNPWDPDRVTGGSSGGSGSAAAAGQCTITTGSDTGGSIRIPAALAPFSSTSFGHFRVKAPSSRVVATKARRRASEATKLRSAAVEGLSDRRIISVAAKLPRGVAQDRPRRPRAAVCSCARIHVDPVSSLAWRAASLRVESTLSKTCRP